MNVVFSGPLLVRFWTQFPQIAMKFGEQDLSLPGLALPEQESLVKMIDRICAACELSFGPGLWWDPNPKGWGESWGMAEEPLVIYWESKGRVCGYNQFVIQLQNPGTCRQEVRVPRWSEPQTLANCFLRGLRKLSISSTPLQGSRLH